MNRRPDYKLSKVGSTSVDHGGTELEPLGGHKAFEDDFKQNGYNGKYGECDVFFLLACMTSKRHLKRLRAFSVSYTHESFILHLSPFPEQHVELHKISVFKTHY